jgi:hypothetical protein
MATLVLGTVGAIVGGPVGAALGSALGQQIDGRLLAPKARHGPRLGDLAVQTSSYGTQIPAIFGTMRVAGTVIWATDLREQKSTSGGGKGRPKSVGYSYSASFAVALSARTLRRVGRIWADGKLLRGAAGDFKAAVKFRLHAGTEDQPVDPLIAAAEGIGQAPAYRGIAYAVFEDLQLADFGNRIPSLTFEVEAEPEPTLGSIAETLSGGEVVDGATPALVGYAATGDSLRGAIEALGELAPLSLREEAGRLVLGRAMGNASEIAAAHCAAGPSQFSRASAAAAPGEVTLAYYDPERDFQTGLQRASTGCGGLRGERRAAAAALAAADAKALAEARLAASLAGRARAKVRLSWRDAMLRPGARVRIEGRSGCWRIERWSFERMIVALDLVGVPAREGAGTVTAAPGRPVAQPDLPHGPTKLVLLDMPLWGDRRPDGPWLLAAAAGVEAGWRSAELLASYDGGASWTPAGSTAAPAVIGTAQNKLGGGGSALFDLRASVDVELLGETMWLESRDDAALAAGANLAAIGDELIQFGSAEPIAPRRFRLSRLLRGRRGTEWAAAGHEAGQTFVLIEPEAMLALHPPAGAQGGEARLLASGIGDADSSSPAVRLLSGEGKRPPSPVHLRAARTAAGDISIRWVRRSRSGFAWTDGADAPLGEEAEAYRVTAAAGAVSRAFEVVEPLLHYSAAQQQADGLTGTLAINVVQLGTGAPSRPAHVTID